MDGLIAGFLVGALLFSQWAWLERESRKRQEEINKNMRQDLEFWQDLANKYEKEKKCKCK